MGYQLPINPDSITIAGHTVPLGGSQNLAASDLTNGTTGSGDIVLETSPTIASPTLTGTASVANITLTGTFNLNGETVSGSATFAGSLTFSGANAYGTPASITLTNATGLPISSGVSGLGTGVATALGSAVTGSGDIVLATSPTVASPTFTGTIGGSSTFAGNITFTEEVFNNSSGATSVILNGSSNIGLGANFQFVGDGETTPDKYIRVSGGQFGIINDAYSEEILTLDDLGNLSAAGNIQTATTFYVNGSQIAASNLADGTTGTGAIVLADAPELTASSSIVATSTGATVSFEVNNNGTSSNSSTIAQIFTVLGTVANGYLAMACTGGADPIGTIITGAGLTYGLSISTGAGDLSLAAAGQILMSGIPSSDPHVSGALWNNSGVLSVSAG